MAVTERDRSSLTLARDGAQRFPLAAAAVIEELIAATIDLPQDQAGVRLASGGRLRAELIADGPIGGVAASALGPDCHPVRAILFDKTAAANWSLGWHQDRTIAVRARRDVEGFDKWTRKSGIDHVEPPMAVLETMVTVRVHLDPVGSDNAPLLIAPGSHRLGLVPESRIAAVVAQCGSVACLAEPGDVWLYATPILHASNAAEMPRRRRVLQVDYAVGELPGGLEWIDH